MRIITEIMSRREAAATRRPELREMKFVIIEPDGSRSGIYWKPDGNGYTNDLDEAGLYELPHVLSRVGFSSSVGFIKEGTPEPGPDGKPRLRMAKLVLGHSLYAMMEASPNNPTVRAHIMAKCGEMPKDELDTAQKLIDWIECDLKLPEPGATLPRATSSAGLVTAAPPPATRIEPAPAFIVETENTEVEHGTCSYSRTEHTRSRVPITAARIAELIDRDEGHDLEEILDYLVSDVDEDAINHANHVEYAAEETEYHDPNDGDGINAEFSRATLKQQLIEYLRRTQTPELLRALGINE